jgi:hypothetical protein
MESLLGFCWLGLPNPSHARWIWQFCEAISELTLAEPQANFNRIACTMNITIEVI